MENTLPKNWVKSKIEDCVVILDNLRRPVNSDERSKRKGDIPYYGATGIAGYIDDYIFDEELVLLGEDGAPFFDKSKNVCFIINGKSWVNNHAHVLKAKKITNNTFLKHYFNQFNFNGYVTGTTRLKLNQGSLKSIPFPLPPLAEQERIVAKLDALFAQHEKMKLALDKIPQLLKDFRQQVLTQAVTGKLTEQWREGKELLSCLDKVKFNREKFYLNKLVQAKEFNLKKPKKIVNDHFDYYEFNKNIEIPHYWKLENLKNFCDLITDGEHSTPKRTSEGFYLLSARNVRDGYLDLSNVDYVDKTEFDRLYQRCNPEFKDILISCSGSVGRISQFPERINAVMVRSAALLKIQSNIEISKFLEFVLRSEIGQFQIDKLKKATAQANLFLEPIGKIVIPFPSLEEQQEIVSRVESLFAKADAIEARYQTLKAKIDSLPQAILHKAFKGELVPQLPTDGDAKELLAEIMQLKEAAKPKKGKKK